LTSTAASASTTSTTAPSAGKDRPELHADFLDRHQREYPERHNASHAVSQQEYEEQQRALQATKIEARENLYRAELQRTRRSVLSTTVGRRRPLSLVATRVGIFARVCARVQLEHGEPVAAK
jgi:hypothetical protein